MRRVLVLHGYAVQEAPNDADGLRRLAEFAPDLVVVDVSLPGKDGLTLIREIGTLENQPPIVALAKLGDSTLEEALSLGATRVVGKPFRLKTLLTIVEDVLEPTNR
jgi:DNA-binding response OmpR family regulator